MTVTRQTLGFWIKAREMVATYEAVPPRYQVLETTQLSLHSCAIPENLLSPTPEICLKTHSAFENVLPLLQYPFPLWPRAMENSSKGHLPNSQRDPTALFISWISFSLQASPNFPLQGPGIKEFPVWPSWATLLFSWKKPSNGNLITSPSLLLWVITVSWILSFRSHPLSWSLPIPQLPVGSYSSAYAPLTPDSLKLFLPAGSYLDPPVDTTGPGLSSALLQETAEIIPVHPTLYLVAWGSFTVFSFSKQMCCKSIKAMNVALRLCYINVYGKKEDGRNRREKINLSLHLNVYSKTWCYYACFWNMKCFTI